MATALELLMEQATERENQAVQALNQARAELEEYYHQIAQIERYRMDYCQQLIDRGKNGLTASEYGHLNRFLTQLDETLKKQREAESHFKSQVESCQAHWLETRKKKRSYEWMLDKKKQQQRQRENHLEQKQMDEFSTLQFARRKSPKA